MRTDEILKYIQLKQREWSRRNGVAFGSEDKTSSIEHNLFQPMHLETFNQFQRGSSKNWVDHIRALHSSAALVVNAFDYWKNHDNQEFIQCLVSNLRQPTQIAFETQFAIKNKPGSPPNLDVTLTDSSGHVVAIESKFTEPLSPAKFQFGKTKYALVDWSLLHHTYKHFQPNILSDTSPYQMLDASQLIKHLLGLLHSIQDPATFRLIYLYYEFFGENGYIHRQEMEHFASIVKQDGIIFHAVSWQSFISRLIIQCREEHVAYTNYLSSRYL